MNHSLVKSDRQYVIVKSTGGAGLGDLLRAALSGFHYTTATYRKLLVLWDDGLYGPKGENIFPQLFQYPSFHAQEKINLECHSVRPVLWRNQLHIPLGDVYQSLRKDDWNRTWALENLSFDQTRFDYDEKILVMWDFDQFYQSWQAANPSVRIGNSPQVALREVAQQYLKPAPNIQSTVDEFQSHYFNDITIGVHVRHTNEKGGETRYIENVRYYRIIDSIRKRHPSAVIFIATDNKDIEEQFKARYSNIVTTSKWLPDNGEALHFAVGQKDKLQGAREALIDMYLLANCNYLIHPAQSSFSTMSAIIGNYCEKSIHPLSTYRKNVFPIKKIARKAISLLIRK